YRGLLDALVPRVGESAAGRVVALRADLAAGAGPRAHTSDAASGAAGPGRLLLALEPDGPARAGVLAALADRPAPGAGARPPGGPAGGRVRRAGRQRPAGGGRPGCEGAGREGLDRRVLAGHPDAGGPGEGQRGGGARSAGRQTEVDVAAGMVGVRAGQPRTARRPPARQRPAA
ncbi:hypothetical protein VM98_33205, partial [Streptomyces rubellomurinus subsp. indigoferus]